MTDEAPSCLRTPPGRIPELTVISVTGSERVAFLNALITADILHLPTGSVRLVAWCDAKGRVERLLRLLIGDREIAILCRHDEREALTSRLNLFSLRRDVKIAPAEGWHVITDTGPESGETPFADVVAGRFIGLTERPEPWRDVQGAWHAAEIAGMVPLLPDTLRGEFLPQMLNLEALDGLSYKKGCYPGQEIIARLHFRGELKRELALLEYTGGQPPSPGATLTLAKEDSADACENSQRAGQVTAVAKLDKLETGAVTEVRAGDANATAGTDGRTGQTADEPTSALQSPYAATETAKQRVLVQAVITVGGQQTLHDASGQPLRILKRQSANAHFSPSH